MWRLWRKALQMSGCAWYESLMKTLKYLGRTTNAQGLTYDCYMSEVVEFTNGFQIPASELEMKMPKGWRKRPKPLRSLPPEEAE